MNAQFISEEQKKAGKEKCRLSKATKEERTNTTDTMKKKLWWLLFFSREKCNLSLSLSALQNRNAGGSHRGGVPLHQRKG